MLSVKQGRIKYHFFKVFGMTRPGIEPRSPGPLANTLSTRPMSRLLSLLMWAYFYDELTAFLCEHACEFLLNTT